jgi:hypothetical protein
VESEITSTHRVEGFALEKCNALNADARSKCKDMAGAEYDAAKANAKA